MRLPPAPCTLPVSRYAAHDFSNHRLEHILTNPPSRGAIGWREPEERWLLNTAFLTTDLARPDHGMGLGFESFRRTHGAEPDA